MLYSETGHFYPRSTPSNYEDSIMDLWHLVPGKSGHEKLLRQL